jgi:uncharacterized membrane protein YidH (DUF202 family)
MRRLLTIFAFAGGLLGLGNYVSDGWTMLSGGRNYYTASNVASVILLAVAGCGAATALLRNHEQMAEEDRKEYLATLVLSVTALVILSPWILFRSIKAA